MVCLPIAVSYKNADDKTVFDTACFDIVNSVVVTGDLDNVYIGLALFVPVAVIVGLALKNCTPVPALLVAGTPFIHAVPFQVRTCPIDNVFILVSECESTVWYDPKSSR